jgi:SAM-dependent methyltransferase
MFRKSREINHAHIKRIVTGDEYISRIYRDIYNEFNKLTKERIGSQPKVLELGGGDYGFAAEFWKDVLVTDAEDFSEDNSVMTNVHAENLPFDRDSFDVVIAKDALHHFKDPIKSLNEILRVLKNNGIFIVSEPYWSPLGRFVYRFFHPEPWDTRVKKLQRNSTDLWDSNQALLLLLDSTFKKELQKLFPNLTIEILKPTYGLSYLASGGVHKRNFLPSKLLLLLNRYEIKNSFMLRITGLNVIAIFNKKS